jgi:hypothetical protein
MNFVGIQRLQRNQTVGYRIVELAVDSRALFVTAMLMIVVVMMALLGDAFVLQRTNPQM